MIKYKVLVGTGEFTTVDGEQKEIMLAILRPSVKLIADSEKLKNKKWWEAAKEGFLLLDKVDELATSLGLWNDDKQVKAKELADKINTGERTLAMGGIKLWGTKPENAQGVAVGMIQARGERADLFSAKNSLVEKTAEAYATACQTNFLIASSIVYNEDKAPYFKSVDEYLEKYNEPLVIKLTNEANKFFNGDALESLKTFPEYAFMIKHKMVDEKLRLLDKQGNLISLDGKRVDEEGYFVNEAGERVDTYGNPLTEEGTYKVEAKPFLDDDGSELVEKVESVIESE